MTLPTEASPLGAELGSSSSQSQPCVAREPISRADPEAEPSAACLADIRRVADGLNWEAIERSIKIVEHYTFGEAPLSSVEFQALNELEIAIEGLLYIGAYLEKRGPR